jgi:hypothetical protein
VQPGTWGTRLSGHMGESRASFAEPPDQGPRGSGAAESEERSDEDGSDPEPRGAAGVIASRPALTWPQFVMPSRVRAHG